VAATSSGVLTAAPAGQAILHAENLTPGHSAQGMVTIHYASSTGAKVGLSQETEGWPAGEALEDDRPGAV
jgi:hypothetical protein